MVTEDVDVFNAFVDNIGAVDVEGFGGDWVAKDVAVDVDWAVEDKVAGVDLIVKDVFVGVFVDVVFDLTTVDVAVDICCVVTDAMFGIVFGDELCGDVCCTENVNVVGFFIDVVDLTITDNDVAVECIIFAFVDFVGVNVVFLVGL